MGLRWLTEPKVTTAYHHDRTARGRVYAILSKVEAPPGTKGNILSWALFIDESGQDLRSPPYEVLAGIAIEDRKLWGLIRQLSDAQQVLFGMRLFDAYGKEAKAQKLLKTKVFKHARQMAPIHPHLRAVLAREILENGRAVTKGRLTALAQAKIAYCQKALALCEQAGARAFASIVTRTTPRGPRGRLRSDYASLFDGFFCFLNGKPDDPMGYLVFDELDRSASHILRRQVNQYFTRTEKGRAHARLIIPEPFFVHSDLTTMIQVVDLVAYIISWGVRLRGMDQPKRNDLADLAAIVDRLHFAQRTSSGQMRYGYRVIDDRAQPRSPAGQAGRSHCQGPGGVGPDQPAPDRLGRSHRSGV